MTGQSGGGGVPSGVAGGVLGGSYPSPTFATNGTTPILGTVAMALGAPVSLTAAYAAALTLALSAGKWLVIACVELNCSSVGAATCKLTDSSSVDYGNNGLSLGTGFSGEVFLVGVVTLAAAGSISVQGRTSGGTFTINANDGVIGGTNGTTITALRIG